MFFTKLLELLLMLVPLVVEIVQRKRSEEETAKDFVKRQMEERLKTYEALEKDTGEELTRLSWDKIHRAMLHRVLKPLHEPAPHESDLPSKGTKL